MKKAVTSDPQPLHTGLLQRRSNQAGVAHHHLFLILIAVVEEVGVPCGLAQHIAGRPRLHRAQIAGVVAALVLCWGRHGQEVRGGGSAKRFADQGFLHLCRVEFCV